MLSESQSFQHVPNNRDDVPLWLISTHQLLPQSLAEMAVILDIPFATVYCCQCDCPSRTCIAEACVPFWIQGKPDVT